MESTVPIPGPLIGLLGRLVCKDFIDLKFDRNAKTYWIPREEKQFTKEDYEKQF